MQGRRVQGAALEVRRWEHRDKSRSRRCRGTAQCRPHARPSAHTHMHACICTCAHTAPCRPRTRHRVRRQPPQLSRPVHMHRARAACALCRVSGTLYRAPYTPILHPMACTLYSAPCCPVPCTLHPVPCTLHPDPAPHGPCPVPCTLHPSVVMCICVRSWGLGRRAHGRLDVHTKAHGAGEHIEGVHAPAAPRRSAGQVHSIG